MHLGYEKVGKIQPSKTKCVFFPPPQYFDKMEATTTLENGFKTQAEMTIASKLPTESATAIKTAERRCQRLVAEAAELREAGYPGDEVYIGEEK